MSKIGTQKTTLLTYLQPAKAHDMKPTSTTKRTPSATSAKSPGTSRKRKQPDTTDARSPSKVTKRNGKDEEKRLRIYRKQAPKSFLEKLERAQTQRMIVISRSRHGAGSSLREDIDIVGTTGNVYRVSVATLPSCTCPDHQKGNECKHKVYALHTVLKAPEHLQYQRAFLTGELEEILAGAPPLPADVGDSDPHDGKRKPIEGECPICYMEFEEDKNELVWCKAACGNNMHKSCFDQWAASQKGQAVRCVYCRTEWQLGSGDLKEIQDKGSMNEEGYINVAEHFGISRVRDMSGYYGPWARRQFGYG